MLEFKTEYLDDKFVTGRLLDFCRKVSSQFHKSIYLLCISTHALIIADLFRKESNAAVTFERHINHNLKMSLCRPHCIALSPKTK